MKRYPIIFGLRDLVQGEGYLAGVVTDGRALVHEEDGYVWVEGVNPGGFAGTGNSPAEALEDFRREYLAILFDLMADATSFESFEMAVKDFFANAGRVPVADWEQAVQDVRSGKVDADWMRRRDAESPMGVRVAYIQQPAAENNRIEVGPALAA